MRLTNRGPPRRPGPRRRRPCRGTDPGPRWLVGSQWPSSPLLPPSPECPADRPLPRRRRRPRQCRRPTPLHRTASETLPKTPRAQSTSEHKHCPRRNPCCALPCWQLAALMCCMPGLPAHNGRRPASQHGRSMRCNPGQPALDVRRPSTLPCWQLAALMCCMPGLPAHMAEVLHRNTEGRSAANPEHAMSEGLQRFPASSSQR